MRNHLNWLFISFFAMALIGCQDDININTPINSSDDLNKSSTVDEPEKATKVIELGQVGDRIWKDLDMDGIQDAGEEGFPGVTVALYKCDGTWLNLVKLTDANGNYLFEDVQPGSYKVRINIPDGWSVSPKDAGSDEAVDSDLGADNYTDCFELNEGELDFTVDCGLYPTPPPLGQLGNRVWLDSNKNGIQDENEIGIQGIKVDLYDCGSSFITSVTTNADGNYLFADIPAGCYKVKFNSPANYSFSTPDQGGNDLIDSDADPSTGFTADINLDAGVIDFSWDCGLFLTPIPLGQLGDRVWKDTDKDGKQDLSEKGFEGVKVELYSCNSTTIKIQETTTNASGLYLFTDLPPGDYMIKFIAPTGYVFSKRDQGTDDTKDSDANTSTGFTTCITLVDGAVDTKWDAGLYRK